NNTWYMISLRIRKIQDSGLTRDLCRNSYIIIESESLLKLCGKLNGFKILTGRLTILIATFCFVSSAHAVFYPDLTYTSTKTLPPGVIHKKATLPAPKNNINIFIIDPTARGAMMVPARPAGINGLQKTSVQANGAKAIAAVNAGFFAYS